MRDEVKREIELARENLDYAFRRVQLLMEAIDELTAERDAAYRLIDWFGRYPHPTVTQELHDACTAAQKFCSEEGEPR